MGCPDGYTIPSETFVPVCDSVTNQYNVSSAGSCTPKNCTHPLNKDNDALYTDCIGRTTGEVCTPSCNDGYHANGTIELSCSEVSLSGVQAYVFDAAGPRCIPNSCTVPPASDGMVFTTCNKMRTGQLCLPTCSSGESMVFYPPTGMLLVCEMNGSYSAGVGRCQA